MVNTVLKRKIYRDLMQRKLSLVALLLIIVLGVASYSGQNAVYRDLDRATQTYYNEYRLGDFTVDLKRAPQSCLEELQSIPNIRNVQGRVSLSVRLLFPEQEEPILGQAISLPFFKQPRINDILIRSGTWFSKADAQEIILNDAFANANHLKAGDRLRVLFLEQEYDLLVVGTAMSPEFVYLISPSGGLAPDPARFGVMYIPERFLQEVSDLTGAYNQVIGKVYQNAPREMMPLLELLEEKLDHYGVTNATAYYDQPSVRFLADELKGLETSSSIMPVIFLGVAALILNVLLGRMVMQQRVIIGTLKALGYGKISIAFHYMSYGLVIGFFGGSLGAFLGYGLQQMLLKLYHQFYALPSIPAHFYLDIYGKTLLLSCFFALLGTIKGVRHSFKLTPAEAMRPPMPEKGGKIFPERFSFFWNSLSFSSKLILRTIFRNPLRSGVNMVASIVATALILCCLCTYDALFYLMDYEFRRLSHEDMQLNIREPKDISVLAEVENLTRILKVEPELIVVSDLSYGPFKKRVGVTGLPKRRSFHTPLLSDGSVLTIPESGLVLSDKLAEILGVKEGHILRFRPLIGQRQEVQAPVIAVVETYLGLSAYADLHYLSRLIGEEASANLLRCSLETSSLSPQLLRELNVCPSILGISLRERMFTQLDQTFGETMGAMIGILVLFAGSIAFGSVLNSTLVSLSEREREVCTLRVLGYSPLQIAKIFAGESLLLNLVGIALGLFAGVGLTHLLSYAYSTELYRFPSVIYVSRLIWSVSLMIFFTAFAQILVYWIIRRIHWLDGLKIKE